MISSRSVSSFFSTQHFHEGVRITIGIMVPVLVASQFQEVSWGLAMALGSLCVSLTDNAGPIHHRINGMLTCILFMTMSSMLIGYALPFPWLVILLLFLFGFFFSQIGLFGNRAASIGTSVLLGVSLQLTSSDMGVWQHSLFLAAGGFWYFFLSLLLYRIRPYKLAQQVLGDCIEATAEYLVAKGEQYGNKPDFSRINNRLLSLQVEVQNKQQLVREIFFKTRSIVKESTHTGRVLVLAFLEIVDIFEKTVALEQVNERTDQTPTEIELQNNLTGLIIQEGERLKNIGKAFQESSMHLEKSDSKNLLIRLGNVIETLKEKLPDQNTNQSLWPIQRMLNALEDLIERIDNLSAFTTYKTSQKLNRKIKYAQFVVPSYINWTLFKDNLQLNSNIFRYALRMAVALPVGYELGQLLEVGHSYWIVLTILVILKPAYALTRQRNLDRLFGTFAGGLVGIFILLFIKSNLLLTIILIGCMVGAFSLIRIRYSLSVALITIYVLVSFYLLSPGDYTPVVKDRLIDTFIGSIISLIFTRLIPPIWEKEQMNELLAKAILSSKEYFNQIILALKGEETNVSTFRWHRKENYIAIANLSDAFQRMLNEPKNRQNHGDYLYQLVVSCHVLASRNAYLSSMIIKLNHTDPVFIQESLVVKTKNQLADAARMLSNPDDSEIKNNLEEIRLNEPEMAIKGISEFSDNQQNEMNSVLISIRHLSKEIKSLCQNFIEN